MKQAQETLTVKTQGPGLTDITRHAADFVTGADIRRGQITLFIRHTSASLAIQENADPDVLADLETFLSRLVSRDPELYRHTTEGADDMPAHIRALLTQTSVTIPIAHGRMVLGAWQAIYVFEHRDAPHVREIVMHLIGD